MKTAFIKFAVFLMLFFPAWVLGTEDYAERTGKSCEVCHVDPIGGEKLTPDGEAFRDDLEAKGLYKPITTIERIARLIIGYLHMMTAFVWFGTIFYVHLFLKPGYAVKGLPKGEFILGWSSMIVMAVTGTLLTIVKVSSWDMLFHTRFGIILVSKIILFLVMVASAAIVTFIIGPKIRKVRQREIQQGKKDLSIEELARFDGKEDRPAYIAYKGTIYDVSASQLWKGGSHLERHPAGFDLTEALMQAPHGQERVIAMPMAGKLLKPKEGTARPFHEKAFYFLAYMNLVLVFLVIFVISLWRW
jgi:predicted heme/steroid binding protein